MLSGLLQRQRNKIHSRGRPAKSDIRPEHQILRAVGLRLLADSGLNRPRVRLFDRVERVLLKVGERVVGLRRLELLGLVRGRVRGRELILGQENLRLEDLGAV